MWENVQLKYVYCLAWQYKHIILLKDICQNDENHSIATYNSNVNTR